MNGIEKEAVNELRQHFVSIDEAIEALNKLAFELRKINVGFNERWNKPPIVNPKPYFRQNEKW